MGKKRKFNRFIRWIKSDLPDDNKSVLLLGITKIPSPTPTRPARPHTLHLDHHLTAKSQTLDSQPRLKPRIFRSHSGDSLNELLTCRLAEVDQKQETQRANNVISLKTQQVANERKLPNQTSGSGGGAVAKKVSFDTNNLNLVCFKNGNVNNNNKKEKRFGICTELPYDFYHSNSREKNSNRIDDDAIPDIIMDKSVDSIGSCSLDVDASSTDFSDSSVGSSDCTLRSLGVPTPTTNPSNPLPPSFQIELTTSTITDQLEPKKPSYLNLACTVNGYSNITNYDSKLRENFRISRSRDVSPIRPQDYHAAVHATTNNESQKFLTPNYPKSLLTSPQPNKNMTESRSQTILRSSQTTSYSSSSYSSSNSSKFMSQETKKFLSKDSVDNVNFMSKTNGVPSTKYSNFQSSETSHSYFNGKTNSISETKIQENHLNGGQKSSKSFIQQRVERLYGPGALAQGFFISKRSKNRLSESENSEGNTSSTIAEANTTFNTTQDSFNDSFELNENDINLRQSCSSPSLPVLRHLRPEFRAQLPMLSPKRVNNDNTIQKSTTVPLLIATTKTNGVDESNGVVSNSENKENIDKQISIDEMKLQTQVATKIITEEIPAAPQVILPISKPDVVNGSESIIIKNGMANGKVEMNGNAKSEVKDGHYFLKILKNETDRLISLAVKAEAELEDNMTILADDVLGYLRSASGKARLLVTQKMQQFEGLCHKNINQIEGEPFPTTAEDLQGFWDMVMLQVSQVDDIFAELDRIKANNWVILEKPKPDANENATKPKKIIVKKPISAEAEAQRKQREAARKQMIEAKRKAMRAKQQSEQTVEIFVPESS